MNDWQPIETAPKDGRTILVCDENQTTPVFWHPYRGPAWRFYSRFSPYVTLDYQPKWWMPLPLPPDQKD